MVQFVILGHFKCNRQISGRIKRPPSQCAGIEMAVGIFIMVLDFYIPAERKRKNSRRLVRV